MELLSESSPPIPSVDPPLDHQTSDSVADQLTALSLDPEIPDKIDADNNGVADDVAINSEEEEIEERENGGIESSEFPERNEADDCTFYLRTGMCKFGMNCKFNHPPRLRIQGCKVKGREDSGAEGVNVKDEYLGNEGLINCKYFDRPGGCKFGKACKFNHSRTTSGVVQLNFMGLPVRPGERECPYYMRNGSCKYGANCRFNHPDPSSRGPDTVSGYSNGVSMLSSSALKSASAPWSPAALNGSPPYVPLIFPPSQGVASQTELNAYQAPIYPPPARNINLPVPPAYAMNGQSLGRNFYTHQRTQILVDEFPERPGQPECSYFVKTGNCKYRSACKFHHPKSVIANSPPCTLSEFGLPLRPGGSICSYYNRYGICKYGPACKYDHPVNYGHPLPHGVSPMNPIPFLSHTVINEQAMTAGS